MRALQRAQRDIDLRRISTIAAISKNSQRSITPARMCGDGDRANALCSSPIPRKPSTKPSSGSISGGIFETGLGTRSYEGAIAAKAAVLAEEPVFAAHPQSVVVSLGGMRRKLGHERTCRELKVACSPHSTRLFTRGSRAVMRCAALIHSNRKAFLFTAGFVPPLSHTRDGMSRIRWMSKFATVNPITRSFGTFFATPPTSTPVDPSAVSTPPETRVQNNWSAVSIVPERPVAQTPAQGAALPLA